MLLNFLMPMEKTTATVIEPVKSIKAN